MTTRESIIDTADKLIRDKGYNAFSFKDISNAIGIKTASIHYHFPTKAALGLATVQQHITQFEALKAAVALSPPFEQLHRFLAIYSSVKAEDKVCIVGSLSTDLNTVDESMKEALRRLAAIIMEWLTGMLEDGRRQQAFRFQGAAHAKALMIVTNMMAIVQLARLTGPHDFDILKAAVIASLEP